MKFMHRRILNKVIRQKEICINMHVYQISINLHVQDIILMDCCTLEYYHTHPPYIMNNLGLTGNKILVKSRLLIKLVYQSITE